MSYKGKQANADAKVNALPVAKTDGREQATVSRPPRRATQFAKKPDMTKWEAAAVVLLIEKRTCKKCETSYSAPSSALYVRLEALQNKSLRSRIVPRKHVIEDLYHLPHETREVETLCECCQNCFQPDDHKKLLEPSLFPQKPHERKSLQQVLGEQSFRHVAEEEKSEALKETKPLSAAAIRMAELLKGG